MGYAMLAQSPALSTFSPHLPISQSDPGEKWTFPWSSKTCHIHTLYLPMGGGTTLNPTLLLPWLCAIYPSTLSSLRKDIQDWQFYSIVLSSESSLSWLFPCTSNLSPKEFFAWFIHDFIWVSPSYYVLKRPIGSLCLLQYTLFTGYLAHQKRLEHTFCGDYMQPEYLLSVEWAGTIIQYSGLLQIDQVSQRLGSKTKLSHHQTEQKGRSNVALSSTSPVSVWLLHHFRLWLHDTYIALMFDYCTDIHDCVCMMP